MTRNTFKNRINKILSDKSTGIFSDDYWKPIYGIWDALNAAGYHVNQMGSQYGDRNDTGVATSKTWEFEIEMEKGKPLYGVIVASGCGSVDDPLSRYDIVAYCS